MREGHSGKRGGSVPTDVSRGETRDGDRSLKLLTRIHVLMGIFIQFHIAFSTDTYVLWRSMNEGRKSVSVNSNVWWSEFKIPRLVKGGDRF